MFQKPKLFCFYNGTHETEDRVVLKLSDCFKGGVRPDDEADVEVKVTMINVNYGRNRKLMDGCKPLFEYSWFIDNIRSEERATGSIGDAVDAAIDRMPNDFLIRDFILNNRAEVKEVCLTEYDEVRTMNQFKEEGRQEGRQEGREEGLIISIRSLMKTMSMTIDQAMTALQIPVNMREKYASMLNNI